MFQDLNVFQLAHAMASHAGKRQSVVSQNIANADTPGYHARDIVPFAEAMSKEHRDGVSQPPGMGGDNAYQWPEFTSRLTTDPNENSVSIEEEMLKAVEVARQHERALSIYRSALSVLRTSLGRGF
ncbi:FlgB family protein [Falsiphaeobacter marinintestinus]|uniref:FlgB family protein n=1 Tax=Falsiphaeobacter marinintestinus TaxID=1492905 RepID=UPI0011B82CA2|nr:FlgB family protein [Phaeobacter marinintestinus]